MPSPQGGDIYHVKEPETRDWSPVTHQGIIFILFQLFRSWHVTDNIYRDTDNTLLYIYIIFFSSSNLFIGLVHNVSNICVLFSGPKLSCTSWFILLSVFVVTSRLCVMSPELLSLEAKCPKNPELTDCWTKIHWGIKRWREIYSKVLWSHLEIRINNRTRLKTLRLLQYLNTKWKLFICIISLATHKHKLHPSSHPPLLVSACVFQNKSPDWGLCLLPSTAGSVIS